MSTTVRIVSPEDGRFGVVTIPAGEAVTAPCERWDQAVASDRNPVRLVRLRPGRGYAINEGPRTLRLTYLYQNLPVGPRTDFLAPGAVKELGIGKGVEWRFEEV